jgi:hypothetical protein
MTQAAATLLEVNALIASKDWLKSPGEVRRHEEKVKSTDKRRKRPMLRKIPQQREYRR